MKLLVVIPAHNEEAIIAKNLERVFEVFPPLLSAYDWRVVVAENGSSDTTVSRVQNLTTTYPRLELMSLTERGKGNAIRTAWGAQDADLFLFMDADLSAELSDIPRLLDALTEADLAIGSRSHKEARIRRSALRTIISHTYNAMARLALSLPIQDFQCGFKAVRQHVVRDLLPKTTHSGFFFDTELIALALHEDYHVAQVPITWTESGTGGRRSQIKLGRTSFELLSNLWELRGRIHRMRRHDLIQ